MIIIAILREIEIQYIFSRVPANPQGPREGSPQISHARLLGKRSEERRRRMVNGRIAANIYMCCAYVEVDALMLKLL
jgi:hypothetical protein